MRRSGVEELMHAFLNLLSALISIYSILILIRILISWFSGSNYYSRPVEILGRITDPYLNWWRNVLNLRIGIMDLSPIVAIAVLSMVRNIIYSISTYEQITIGTILALILASVWSIVSFVLGFFIIVLIIRMFAYITNRNILSPFWRVVDSISQPVLYKTNRIIFGRKIPGYLKGIIVSTLALTAIWVLGGFLMPVFASLLAGIPL
jgi:YggT family protein